MPNLFPFKAIFKEERIKVVFDIFELKSKMSMPEKEESSND